MNRRCGVLEVIRQAEIVFADERKCGREGEATERTEASETTKLRCEAQGESSRGHTEVALGEPGGGCRECCL